MTRIVAVALLGLSLRLAVSGVEVGPPIADMAQYHDRAVYMREHQAFGPDALRGPGYPLLLVAAYSALGESTWAARVANSIVGALLVLASGLLARASGCGGRAWIASAIVAVYPGYLLSTLYLMSDTFYTLLSVTCLLLIAARPGALSALGTGVVIGAGLLVRSAGLVLIPAVGVAWALDLVRRRVTWKSVGVRGALAAVACAVVIAPWLFFTARVAGRPVLDTTAGYNALIGANPRATGRLELQDGTWIVETYMQGAASVADAELQGVRAAARWASENPQRWLKLGVAKLAYLWGLEGREHSALYSHQYYGELDGAVVLAWGIAVLVSFPLLVAAAIVGVAAAPGGWTPIRAAIATVIVVTSALHVLTFGESRFHLPLVPLMAAVAPLAWPWSPSQLTLVRTGGAVAVLGLLTWAWAGQHPGLWQRLDAIRQPGGSAIYLDY